MILTYTICLVGAIVALGDCCDGGHIRYKAKKLVHGCKENIGRKQQTRMIFTVCLVSAIIVLEASCGAGHTMDEAENFDKMLLLNYSKSVRPVWDQLMSVNVDLYMTLISITGFNEVSEELSLVVLLEIVWKDERLAWNPQNSSNIYSTVLRHSNLWTPNIILSNPTDDNKVLADDMDMTRILYNGKLTLITGKHLKSSCEMELTFYPFDIQTCHLQFVSWGYSIYEVELSTPSQSVSLGYYSGNGMWQIVDTNAYSYNQSHLPFADFELTFKRRPTFLLLNIIVPILLLASLNALVFVLPPSSGERMSLAITILLALAVFMTLVADSMPPTSRKLALLSFHLMNILVYSSCIVLASVVSLRFHLRDDTEPTPTWMKSLARSCCRRNTRVKRAIRTETNDGATADHGVSQTPGTPTTELTWKDVATVIDYILLVFFLLWLILSMLITTCAMATRSHI